MRIRFEDIYVSLFGRASMQRRNDKILRAVLRARGFNNSKSHTVSGESRMIDIIAATRPKICIDIGANRGDFTRLLLEKTDANVVSFEPLPPAFEQLSALDVEFPGRLSAVNKGVGDAPGHLDIHYRDDALTHASFSSEVNAVPYVDNAKSLSVEVTTLDAHFAGDQPFDTVDFLKIDTEGFEFEVLNGAKAFLARFRPAFVQIEYNWHQLFRGQSIWSLSHLLPGYRLYQLLPDGPFPRDPKDPESNICHFSNFVFVREDVSL